MASKRIRFEIPVTDARTEMQALWAKFRPNVLNSTAWRGKEPRSCAVTRLSSRPAPIGTPTVADIEVTYKPKGHISYTGQTKYDGWTAMMLERKADGTLLDATGQPLKDGELPVYTPKEVYQDKEFNDLDFGKFIDETDIEDVKHTTAAAIHEELETGGGTVSISVQSNFVAQHRQRPHKKLVLSNGPSGLLVDGFGGHQIHINLSTPHLELVLMEQLAALMCEFIEGKASFSNDANANVVFAKLSDTLVDCEPNEHGLESWFNVMHMYTPLGFLEDLAKRLMAVYAIDVSVIDGKEGGLVLRHEAKGK